MLAIGRTTTREERLGWNPDEAVATALENTDERAVIWTAMFDQLEGANVPLEALEMSIMFWSRALDGLDAGVIPADRLARLDQDLRFDREQMPVFGQWLDAFRRRVHTAHDLDWTIQFLLQVRQTWALSTAVRSKNAP